MEKLEYDDFAPLLGPWCELFRPFIESKEMYDIYQKLKQVGIDEKKKEIIVPNPEQVFRAFATTSPHTVKTIWYLMDPYPKRYKNKMPQATGIAMDCSNSPDDRLQPSLEVFYDALDKDMGKQVKRSKSLEYLSEQGVMMLNTDLTCFLKKTGSHKGWWEPFQKYFLEEIMGSRTDVVYVLSGKQSLDMEPYINPFCKIFKIDHPAHASHRHMDWEYKDVFNKTNKILTDLGKEPVCWDKEGWLIQSEAPF